MLHAAKQPLYKGYRNGHSPLLSARRLMVTKNNYNLTEECVYVITVFVRDFLHGDNIAPVHTAMFRNW